MSKERKNLLRSEIRDSVLWGALDFVKKTIVARTARIIIEPRNIKALLFRKPGFRFIFNVFCWNSFCRLVLAFCRIFSLVFLAVLFHLKVLPGHLHQISLRD